MEDLIRQLSLPAAYPHSTKGIKVIQTAISVVFLTGEYAYKCSKPVNFGFLDFSTLEKRKENCEKEVQFNSLISPDLYIGISSVNSNGSTLKVDSNTGTPIEYLIRMKQCDPESTMSSLLKQELITPFHLKELVSLIYNFHKKAHTSPQISEYGKIHNVRFNWDENFEQTAPFVSSIISLTNFNYLKEKIDKFLADNELLFQKRVDSNQIKHCHGDLHTGNIFIEQDKILIFDGIVFNQRFPCSDVIADLAFMAMDLDYHGKEDYSQLLLEEYHALSHDNDIYRLIDFYKCYRAYVKGKVNCFMLNDPNISSQQKETIKESAKVYFDLAEHYAHLL